MMRVPIRIAAAAWVAILLCALGSCASQTAGSTTSPAAGATDAGTPPTLLTGALRISVVQAKVLTSTQANGLTSMPWMLTARDDKKATIGLLYVTGDGDCVKPRGIYLRQTASFVLVDVLSATANRTVCASSLTMARSLIHLDEPLGTRALIHARVSHDWATQKFFRGLTS